MKIDFQEFLVGLFLGIGGGNGGVGAVGFGGFCALSFRHPVEVASLKIPFKITLK